MYESPPLPLCCESTTEQSASHRHLELVLVELLLLQQHRHGPTSRGVHGLSVQVTRWILAGQIGADLELQLVLGIDRTCESLSVNSTIKMLLVPRLRFDS